MRRFRLTEPAINRSDRYRDQELNPKIHTGFMRIKQHGSVMYKKDFRNTKLLTGIFPFFLWSEKRKIHIDRFFENIASCTFNQYKTMLEVQNSTNNDISF